MTAKSTWGKHFHLWALPLGDTERDRCASATEVIQEAVATNSRLSESTIRVFPYGSCYNGTSARTDTPVDVCVVLEDALSYDLPKGRSAKEAGLQGGRHSFDEYRQTVRETLERVFGRAHVRHGDHSSRLYARDRGLQIHATPCFPYRLYESTPSGDLQYQNGVALGRNLAGVHIAAFPQQQQSGCDAKDESTEGCFREMVRVVKALRVEMENADFDTVRGIHSFQIESLIWNIDDYFFGEPDLYDRTLEILGYLWDRTRTNDVCGAWTESNGLAPLFHMVQTGDREQANQFLYDAWNRIKSK